MDTITLAAEPRKVLGRKVSKLRKEGMLPVNVYGKKIASAAFSVKLSDFLEVYKKAGETSLIDLGGRAVLVSNVQLNPVSDIPIHVDFRQVDLKEKVTAAVPVEITGESPAEKQALGTVVQYINEIEVEALPVDLPERFIIDKSNLTEVDQAVYIKDLDYDKKKVEVKTDVEQIVAKVEPPQKEEVVEVAPTPVEGEVPAEGAPVEGAPIEGQTESPEPIQGQAPEAPKK